MKRRLLWATVVVMLTGAAWSAGRAQATVADFEIMVDAPGGTVVVACHHGCAWSGPSSNVTDRATGKVIPNSAGENTTVFECGAERCQGRINGRGFVNR
jgi:hypothetical protein